MNPRTERLAAGLYLVAVPIGTARDITLRALDILASAEVLVAEDTRSLRHLMEIHGISLGDRPLWAYHDHNGGKMRPRIMAALAEGRSVAYASEAGTPMIADPGFDLVRSARDEGLGVIAAPGPSAVVTALTVAGLPTDRFLFEGFLPNSASQRKTALREIAGVQATLVFYESPKRVAAMLRDAAEVLGPDREAALCRELTKKFEEVIRAPLGQLAEEVGARSLKGEIVVLIDRGTAITVDEAHIEARLRVALESASVRDAADKVAQETGWKRRQVYQMALQIEKGD
ncbi:16S rRNA (cytidine(1402)-2'-O)-methyltransferase [Roseovarius nubinhibens]|nr:16S rRNA (cytidine(1402)-2'-O)-methyltransferase [Roseovarius nubinhibens]MBU2998478.1 16S rRNA (cytidine(1402)-2'-O)-methyltransferase [Roseovarius nubinhibens]